MTLQPVDTARRILPWGISFSRRTLPVLLLGVFLILFYSALSSGAEETGPACHCFRNRVYDPEDKFGADDYMRATAVNSLVSGAFGIPRQQIVMMRMNGVPLEELLTALYVSRDGRGDYRVLLDLRSERIGWTEAFARIGLAPEAVEPRFKRLMGKHDEEIMGHVQDSVVAAFFSVEPAEMIQLRKAGAENIRDRVLAIALAFRLNIRPDVIVRSVLAGTSSWGELANRAGLTPEDMGAYVESLGKAL